MKILLCDYHISNHGEKERAYLKQYLPEAELEAYEYTDEKGLMEKAADADVIMTCFLKIGGDVIRHAPRLKMISVDATGYGNIDMEACRERGVLVATLGDYCTQEVADHAMALILSLEKNLKAYDKNVVQKKEYSFQSLPCRHRLSGQVLAVVGYGRIGKAVALRAKAFGFRVVAVTRHPELIGSSDGVAEYVSLEEALESADVISNHMNQNEENDNYFDLEKFQKMKKRPLFINVSRGACVDETALIYALQNNLIAGAGLDVLKDTKPDGELIDLLAGDNVILTPHSAFYSKEVMEFLDTAAIENVVSFCLGRKEKITHIVSMT